MLRGAGYLLQRGAQAFGAVSAVAVGQALVHDASYVPLPTPRAETVGTALPAAARKLRDEAEARAQALRDDIQRRTDALRAKRAHLRVLLETPDEADGVRRLKWWFREDARDIAERAKAWLRDEDTKLARLKRWFRDDEGENLRRTATGATGAAPRYRVLFIGDSLVTGVGGSRRLSEEQGPPLARRVSRALADRIGVEVEWRALGLTGGDVSRMRAELVPELEGTFDLAVVMCGLNDFKRLARGELRTPWGFRRELELLIGDIRAQAGADCRVALPAYPLAVAGFPDPLRSYIGFVAARWDEQKRALAGRLGTTFVDVFETPDDAGYTAADRVHPNECGYELWAQHIAGAVVADIRA